MIEANTNTHTRLKHTHTSYMQKERHTNILLHTPSVTSLFGCHLAGDAWHITVEPCPASLALTAVSSASLPTGAPVLTWGRVTPAYQILRRHTHHRQLADRGTCFCK